MCLREQAIGKKNDSCLYELRTNIDSTSTVQKICTTDAKQDGNQLDI